jgi:TRAP-type transport system periplasmic protein
MPKRYTSWGRGLLILFCTLLSGGVSGRAVALEINVATAYANDNFHTGNLRQYAEEVTKLTNGQVRLTIHAGGSLLKPTDIFVGVRAGKAEAGEVIMSSLSNEIPLFGIDSLPFIVSGYHDARRMWDASRPAVERALDERGIQLLYAVPWPPQNLFSRRPINSLQDFKGLRMRSYNDATKRIAEHLKLRPVAIQAVDLGKAIADDSLDVMITSSTTGVETRAWSALNHYYKVNAWIPKNIVFINKATFSALDADTRQKLLDAARASEERGWRQSESSDARYEVALSANKMNISHLDPLIRRYLDRIGENLAREWLKKAGREELMVLLTYTTDRSMK